MRGIFIGFDTNKKGYLFYMPGSRYILSSADAIFDESFHSAIATTWQQHRDTLALQPTHIYIGDVTTVLEHTGTINDNLADVEEGEITKSIGNADNMATSATEDDNMATLTTEDDEPAVYYMSNENQIDSLMEHPDKGSLIVVSRNNDDNSGPRRSKRVPKPNPKYARNNTPKKSCAHVAEAVGWANICTDLQLVEACAAEAHPDIQPITHDANSWKLAPKTVRDILKMENGIVRQEWLKALKKELKTLIKAGTLFVHDNLKDGEISTPVMETFKVKVKSDGSLDKLKARLVVRGDLQDKNITEDKWSPTATFCSLKMFLGHASRIKARIKQLDFVGAFLQAKMRTRMFVTIRCSSPSQRSTGFFSLNMPNIVECQLG
jgi:hypothetical protein